MEKPLNALLIALLLLSCCCAILAQSKPDAQQTPDQSAGNKLRTESGHQQAQPTTEPLLSQQVFDAFAREINAAAEKAQAQQPPTPPDNSSWLSTWLLVLFTGILTLVGVVQTYLIFKTLKATAIAANAARDSANIAKDAMIISQRPYVFMKGWSQACHRDVNSPGGYVYTIQPILKNMGNTPTKELSVIMGFECFPTTTNEFQITADAANKKPSIIGPRGTILGVPLPLSAAHLAAVQKGTMRCFMWGIFTYRDGFHGTPLHKTEVCYVMAWVRGDPTNPGPAAGVKGTMGNVRFDFKLHDKFNSAD